MKVLHIANDFSLTRVHKNLYTALDRNGIEQVVYNPVRKGTPLGQNHFDFEDDESEIIYSKYLKNHHRLLYRKKINFLFKDLTSKVNYNKISLIHATTLFSDGGVALKIKKKIGIPYIVAIRATDIDVFLKFRPDLIFKAYTILKEAGKIIFISNSLKNRFLNHYLVKPFKHIIESKSEIIYNGIDDFWLDNSRKQNVHEFHNILYVGRFVPRKNIPILAKAILKLNDEGYNLKLNLVGEGGSDETKLKILSQENKGTINFLGPIKEKDKLLKVYRKNSVFAMPSVAETFGLVYLEALSQGLPILYTKDDGVDGVFNFAVGEACNNLDFSHLSERLKNLIHNYNSLELDKIDFSKFRWNNISVKYCKTYKEICNMLKN